MGRRLADDPRNKLLISFFEHVAVLRPRFFLMENVPGLLEKSNRDTLDSALGILPQDYKVLEPMILDAADYGSATSRPRLVVIGYDRNELDDMREQEFAGRMKLKLTVHDAIADLPGPSSRLEWLSYRQGVTPTKYGARLRRMPRADLGSARAIDYLQNGQLNGFQTTVHTKAVERRFAMLQPGQRDQISKYPRLSWDRPAFVLRAGTGSEKGSFQAARPVHPDQPRVITVREAARIQGFPDWFQFHPTKWHSHRMIGNSVSPVFAEGILRIVLSKMGLADAHEAA